MYRKLCHQRNAALTAHLLRVSLASQRKLVLHSQSSEAKVAVQNDSQIYVVGHEEERLGN